MNLRVRFLSRCSALCVIQAGTNFKHTSELTFKQQIFMIFIVDYFCKKEFLKIKKIKVRGQSFYIIQRYYTKRYIKLKGLINFTFNSCMFLCPNLLSVHLDNKYQIVILRSHYGSSVY